MRVLYDISNLGLGELYRESRGGGFRVDMQMVEQLAASPDCELLFCANHSAVAFHGCQAFLRTHPRLGTVPLVAPENSLSPAIRTVASAAHRYVRYLVGSHVFPSMVRRVAGFVDRRLHPPVSDATSTVDILHSPTSSLPPGPSPRSPQRFLTVYDLAPFRLPAIYGDAYRRSLMRIIRSLQPGDHVITPSNFAREELLADGVASPDRIHVVPLAADSTLFYRCNDPQQIAEVRLKYGIPEGPYILGVNTPDLRKNVPHAIHAFARAAHERADVTPSLVLTGRLGWGLDRIHEAIVQYPELRERFILTGYIPDTDLAPLYTGARALVYPSIYEGFGLPPLEAMQCGTPVITSNTSSLPEVVGDGGVLLAADDLDGLAEAMLDLVSNTDRHAALQQRALAQAGRFGWEQSAATLLQAYRTALQARRINARSRETETVVDPVLATAASGGWPPAIEQSLDRPAPSRSHSVPLPDPSAGGTAHRNPVRER